MPYPESGSSLTQEPVPSAEQLKVTDLGVDLTNADLGDSEVSQIRQILERELDSDFSDYDQGELAVELINGDVELSTAALTEIHSILSQKGETFEQKVVASLVEDLPPQERAQHEKHKMYLASQRNKQDDDRGRGALSRGLNKLKSGIGRLLNPSGQTTKVADSVAPSTTTLPPQEKPYSAPYSGIIDTTQK